MKRRRKLACAPRLLTLGALVEASRVGSRYTGVAPPSPGLALDVLYFAYGSNLHPRRLSERVGDVSVDSLGELRAFRLRLDKRGRDGSGKCHVVNGAAEARVYGALYPLTTAQARRLDDFESVGSGYERRSADVHVTTGEIRRCFTYVAMQGFVDERLRPFAWYMTLVQLGARFHGFPDEYLAQLARHPVKLDPDPRRAAEQRRRIFEIREPTER